LPLIAAGIERPGNPSPSQSFLLPSHPVRESEMYLGIGGIILLIIILYLLFR
jgi:hypothetical protein